MPNRCRERNLAKVDETSHRASATRNKKATGNEILLGSEARVGSPRRKPRGAPRPAHDGERRATTRKRRTRRLSIVEGYGREIVGPPCRCLIRSRSSYHPSR